MMKLIFTVTNDLTYDQRMQRIGGTLAANGYSVLLLGRSLPHSLPLETLLFDQKRFHCFFQKGFAFYAEYNLRLFFFLLFAKYDAVCSIDLDTLAAGTMAAVLRRKKRVFDAHEFFTEVPEVVSRPAVRLFWEMVAHTCLPFYRHAYTVGPALARVLGDKYGLHFGVVRNMPSRSAFPIHRDAPTKTLLYQGALNQGRGIETMLEAMTQLENVQLVLAGEGDLSAQLRQQATELQLGERVVFLGYVRPRDLKELTENAWLGLNLLENQGQSYYLSLANKFFDTVQAGVPVLTMDFPEYRALNAEYKVAILLEKLTPESVVAAIKHLLNDKNEYDKLRQNCLLARETWNWDNEQERLLEIWRAV